MTDKEKLEAIRAEILRLVDVRGYDREMANDLLAFMDSLPNEPAEIDFEQELYKAFGQVKDFTLGMRIAKWFYDMGKNSQEPVSEEEPAPKVLEDMFNAKSAAESLGISQEEYDKIVDECIFGKEEPVSEDNTLRKASEEYLKVLSETPYNNTPITNAQTIVRELITFLDNPSKYNPNHREEPVSEDLDKEDSFDELLQELYIKYKKEVSIEKLLDIASNFVKWQKEQDQSTVELAKDHAMFAGMEKMKEQMMKDAVDGVVEYKYSRSGKNLFDVGSRVLLDAAKYHVDDGEKVKLIIVKE